MDLATHRCAEAARATRGVPHRNNAWKTGPDPLSAVAALGQRT